MNNRTKYRLVAAVGVAFLALAACASPTVTGMKVYMQDLDFDSTVRLADSAIAEGDSLDAELWFWRGKAKVNLRDWYGAAESFQRTNELDADGRFNLAEYWFTFYNVAAAELGEGRIESSVDFLHLGNEIVPERPDYDLMLGDIELNINADLDASLQFFTTAAEKGRALIAEIQADIERTRDPGLIEFYNQHLGMVETATIQALFNSGSVLSMKALEVAVEESADLMDAAIASYYRALHIDQTNISVLDAIAGSYMLVGAYEEAIATYNKAFAQIDSGVSEGWMEPDVADEIRTEMYVAKGYALLEMEKYEEAIAELNAARAISGDDFIVLTTMAHAHFVMENYEEALSMLDYVMALEGLVPSELANAYYLIFACFSRLEMDVEAAEALETSLYHEPDNIRNLELLASTYSRLGLRSKAIEAMEKAESLREQ